MLIYYELVRGDTVVGVGTTEDLRKHQKEHNILLFSDEKDAQYIKINDLLYRDEWMRPTEADFELFPYEEISIIPILKDEYDILKKAIEDSAGNDIKIETVELDDNEELEQPDEVVGELTVDYVRENKIAELSLACNRAITNGFDIDLSDGETHHFSMTLQDQANLNSAYMSILAGESEIPYHADGEDMKLFSAEDITEVINASNAHKTYHLAYFNSLNKWLNSVRKISTIESIEYGSTIPSKYRTTLLKKYTEVEE